MRCSYCSTLFSTSLCRLCTRLRGEIVQFLVISRTWANDGEFLFSSSRSFWTSTLVSALQVNEAQPVKTLCLQTWAVYVYHYKRESRYTAGAFQTSWRSIRDQKKCNNVVNYWFSLHMSHHPQKVKNDVITV